jgi:LPXTG-motif cell wall-anchored protein
MKEGKRSMKRMKLVILTMALSLMMSVEAFAAPSAGGTVQVSQEPQQVSVVKSDGTVSTETVIPTVSGTSQTISINEIHDAIGTPNECSVYLMDVSLALAETGEKVKLNGSVTLSFSVPNVISSTKVVVVHWKDDGTKEVLPATAGDGRISVTFTSLSPIAIIVENVSSAGGNANNGGGGSSSGSSSSGSSSAAPASTPTGTSPKTGETSMIYAVEGLAVLAAIGVVVSKKKLRA